jgi:choline dehydrogenase
MVYDFVIVGAGSAGCVLAARLSEDRNCSVMLLEAGPDYAAEADLPPEIRSGFNPTQSHDWGYASEPRDGVPAIPQWRGRLVGGCSATNGMLALRGAPADYDEWAALGNEGWSFAEVLPCFRKLERDLDFDDPWHGRDGPLPIRRYPRNELVPGQGAFLEACAKAGFAVVEDHNAPGAVGAGRVPVNSVGGVRRSAALTYVAAARARPNLAIRGACHVDRVVFDGRRAAGVRLAENGEAIAARRVILAAGAFGSPAILLRSGIGPAADLQALGIKVLADLPGVGRNLCDHPRLGMRFAAPRPATPEEVPGCQVMLTMRSAESVAGHDLQVFPWSVLQVTPAESPTGGRMTIHASVMKPQSRGVLRLRSPDPAAAPLIDPAYFTHPDDMGRMLLAVRTARRLAATAPLSELALHELLPGPAITAAEGLAAAIRASLGTYFHPVGTCSMGPRSNPLAVVDSRGKVHGADDLHVVDAAIMPTIPAANTNLPTLMLAERCAAWLRDAARP